MASYVAKDTQYVAQGGLDTENFRLAEIPPYIADMVVPAIRLVIDAKKF